MTADTAGAGKPHGIEIGWGDEFYRELLIFTTVRGAAGVVEYHTGGRSSSQPVDAAGFELACTAAAGLVLWGKALAHLHDTVFAGSTERSRAYRLAAHLDMYPDARRLLMRMLKALGLRPLRHPEDCSIAVGNGARI